MKSIRSLLIWPSCKEAGHKRPHIWFHSEISRAFRHANAGGGVALKWPRVRRCQTVETDHMAAVQGRSLTTVPWAARNRKKSASWGKETFPCPFRSQRPLLHLGSSSPSSKPAGPRLTPGHLISFHITWLTYLDTSHDWYILTHHITDESSLCCSCFFKNPCFHTGPHGQYTLVSPLEGQLSDKLSSICCSHWPSPHNITHSGGDHTWTLYQ